MPELVACKDEFFIFSSTCKDYTADVPKEECDLPAILSKDRQSLKEDNIRSLNLVQFNDKHFSNIKPSVVFNENEVMEIEYQEI